MENGNTSKTTAIAVVTNAVALVAKVILAVLTASTLIAVQAVQNFVDLVLLVLQFSARRADLKRQQHISSTDQAGPQWGYDGGPTVRPEPPPGAPSRLAIERLVALPIGILLLAVGGFSLAAVFLWDQRPWVSLQAAFPAGIVMFVLAWSNRFVSSLTGRFAVQNNDRLLKIQSDRAAANMTGSFVVAVMLLAAAVGLPNAVAQRIGAFVVSLMLLLDAIDILGNFVTAYFAVDVTPPSAVSPRSERFQEVIEPRVARVVLAFLASLVGIQIGRYTFTGLLHRHFVMFVFAVAILLWLSSCFVAVRPYQQAILERLGQPVNLHNPWGPGFHLKWPWPIDRAVLINTGLIVEEDYGHHEAGFKGSYVLWTQSHVKDEEQYTFITGGGQLVAMAFSVHYRLTDPAKYYMHFRDLKGAVWGTGREALTETLASRGFYDILVNETPQIAEAMHRGIQKRLDELGTGVVIEKCNVVGVHPPVKIAADYESVIGAEELQEQMLHDARADQYEKVFSAKAKAYKQIKSAQGKSASIVNIAIGKARRFLSTVSAFKAAGEVGKMRLRFDTIVEALKDHALVIVDEGLPQPHLWFRRGGKAIVFEQGSEGGEMSGGEGGSQP